MRRRTILFILAFSGFSLAGLASCSNFDYYAQCVSGHVDVMRRCRPIPQVIEDPDTRPELKKQLQTILEIRDFASRELRLPENGSYRSYADLERPYVVWNVVAAPEFSLEPLQWCFPVAGCVAYRGYFKREEAERFADGLRAAGHDVTVYGVAAYSTLNWFDDPVLNTFCNRPEPNLAGLIFHELAHQRLYVKGDSGFNEAFAKTVELEGVARWLASRGEGEGHGAYLAEFHREEQFIETVLEYREKLKELYARPLPFQQKRARKQEIYDEMRSAYDQLKSSWGGSHGYDRWFGEGLNNARLVSISTYRVLVPAFRELLGRAGGDLEAFYTEAAKLGKLPVDSRGEALDELTRAATLLPVGMLEGEPGPL
ncbi:aminopeptidase [Desulfuromonas versatilis]|uniref:Aminopeptidase n=1 Tax=Desulfuromonas versatilis TaxID=2802975 RepID=A0ABN6DZS3_9BACT|nr:aminopeptidase [Desulfuromonas versatilis]BCR05580.1 aminopeptidase [Desulfuromonas versatilis]